MNQKYLYWVFILIGFILPVIFDSIANDLGKHYPFIWSILLIPSIMIMVLYPSWKAVIGTAFFNSIFELVIEFYQGDYDFFSLDSFALFLGMIVNWSIHFTIGFFRLKSENLLSKVEDMTITDPLTGLYNRRYFDLYIEKAIPLSKKVNFPLILVMIDIDHFKKVNDTFGHVCGDYALKHIAKVVNSNVRESDVLIRMGGEEFAILFPETTIEEGKQISERIRAAVEKTEFIYKGKHIPITVSLGLTVHHSENVEAFIERTDSALYLAKSKGRNQLVVI